LGGLWRIYQTNLPTAVAEVNGEVQSPEKGCWGFVELHSFHQGKCGQTILNDIRLYLDEVPGIMKWNLHDGGVNSNSRVAIALLLLV
jgi:hypothetical protein